MGRIWDFAIDRGGTFTDVIARSDDGQVLTQKLLSENPRHYADSALEAIARVLATQGGSVGEVRMGTTVATNALLERTGERTALAITSGLGDALRIGTQARPDIFARKIVLPSMLYSAVVEIEERMGADGSVVRVLDESKARHELEDLRDLGFDSLAILFMHGWKYPDHEARIVRIARDLGFRQVSASHEVAPLIKFVPRGDTSVADAYLSPVLRRYVERVEAGLPGPTTIHFMQSNGGLAQAHAFRGKDAILSGPAGGVVGMVEAGAAHGVTKLIGFDMGGTSTDVSHYSGRFELGDENLVAGVRVRAPMMQIHTVAAGGGSICRFDGMRFRVGPESAGADPGPACYRNGGPLTLTDCNLFLGRIDPDRFPAVFGDAGDQPLDLMASQARLEEVRLGLGGRMTLEQIAEGFLAIAVDNMAAAIRKISIARGHDVTQYTLACFGGAGGQFACRVADALGMTSILVHPLAGYLSAFGIGLAEIKAIRTRSLDVPLGSDLAAAMEALEREAIGALRDQGVEEAGVRMVRSARIRTEGSDSSLPITLDGVVQMAEEFRRAHRRRFGYDGDGALIIDSLSIEAIASHRIPSTPTPSGDSDQRWPGPALIAEDGSTLIVEPDWIASRQEDGSLLLTRHVPVDRQQAAGTVVDPIRLEIFNNLFMAIAEEMGVALQQTATSVNIKERLDFSCAIFDRTGALIANAPHIPVHLGSMGESIATIIRNRSHNRDGRGLRRGDAYVLNDPYRGGTHLPDITVVMPVFYDSSGTEPDAFVAARGHHADVGGIAPGSMPPDSKTIADEGVLIDDVLLVDEGRLCDAEIRAVLSGGLWPARNPDRNLADLKAQVSACTRGAEALAAAARDNGADVVNAYMAHVLANAEEMVRRLLDRLDDGAFAYAMDNGATVSVAIRIDKQARSAEFDFTGTSAQLADNFNAPFSIARAASLYVVRTLIDEAIPMNDGCLKPITLIVPTGSMLRPNYPAAVVAGNVETSQVVTDCLFAATGRLAPAQGTMNNFTFGNARHQYYETICGGSGAGPDFDGTSAVQTHMTNSRLTDPEILETRLPVRLERFCIRKGSGGEGDHRGGDGVIREVVFLEPMRANILANRREVAPRGIMGGGNAQPGRNWIEGADGRKEMLGASGLAEVGAGDRFVIETPGGGGFGKARG